GAVPADPDARARPRGPPRNGRSGTAVKESLGDQVDQRGTAPLSAGAGRAGAPAADPSSLRHQSPDLAARPAPARLAGPDRTDNCGQQRTSAIYPATQHP